MTWNRHYLDILKQLYFRPDYLSLRSIPQRSWIRGEGVVTVPADKVNFRGPLYSRQRKVSELLQWLMSQEEILNHVFNVTFGIAPDAMIRKCLLKPLNVHDPGPFDYLSREVSERYGWSINENVTQHDGLIVGPQAIVGVELKLRACSSLDQILKYAALITWEELLTGIRPQIGLLYVLPESRLRSFWRRSKLDLSEVNSSILTTAVPRGLPTRIRNLIADERCRFEEVLDRMVIKAITWEQLCGELEEFASQLDVEDPGGQTLQRLIAGLVAQINQQLPARERPSTTVEP